MVPGPKLGLDTLLNSENRPDADDQHDNGQGGMADILESLVLIRCGLDGRTDGPADNISLDQVFNIINQQIQPVWREILYLPGQAGYHHINDDA